MSASTSTSAPVRDYTLDELCKLIKTLTSADSRLSAENHSILVDRLKFEGFTPYDFLVLKSCHHVNLGSIHGTYDCEDGSFGFHLSNSCAVCAAQERLWREAREAGLSGF